MALGATASTESRQHPWLALRDAFLRAYSQVLFSRSRAVGALLLAATCVHPRAALFGGAAVLIAIGVAHALGFDGERVRSGLYGYNALLLGLGGGLAFGHSGAGIALVAMVVGLSVVVTAGVEASAGRVLALPTLTLPFLGCFFLLLLAAPTLGLFPPLSSSSSPWRLPLALPAALETPLRSLGGLFFVPAVAAGLLVLAAALVYSRFGTLLLLLGASVALVGVQALADGATTPLAGVVALNAGLTGLAVGGVWFVPGPAALVLALLSGLACSLVTLASAAALSPLGLPPLILPFNLTVLGVLLALRLRGHDRHPKAVDFWLGTPEQNLRYFRTRVARFGSRYSLRLHAPFRGAWTCTQSVDGPHTHQGPFRHALDFEVQEAQGGPEHRGDGSQNDQFFCYRLPVLATADGVVARTVDGVPDTAVGEVDTVHNWGNLVVLYHSPGLYSAVCHLSPGSLRVREGQVVRQGEVLALCGSSGRSPRPHLHFQLQASDKMGTATVPIELHDVVRVETDELVSTVVPAEGQVLRNLQEDGAASEAFPEDGVELVFEDDDGVCERLVSEIDLTGARRLRSLTRDAELYFERAPGLLTVLDVLGDEASVLRALRFALPRLPSEASATLHWSDRLSHHDLLGRGLRLVGDFIAPFVPGRGLCMRYSQRVDGGSRVIEGRGEQQGPLQTRAVLRGREGLVEIEWQYRGRMRRFRRRPTQEGSA